MWAPTPVPIGTVNHPRSPAGCGIEPIPLPDSTMPTEPTTPTPIQSWIGPTLRRTGVGVGLRSTPLPLPRVEIAAVTSDRACWRPRRYPGRGVASGQARGGTGRRSADAPSSEERQPPRGDVVDQRRPLVAEEQDQDEREEHEERLQVPVAGEVLGRQH